MASADDRDRTGPRIAVLDYGIGNLRSAQKALQRVGADATLTADPGLIAAADGVVLPGVGNFGACMTALRRSGLAEQAMVVAERGQPFIGICVGMQMLFDESDESPGIPGLGLLPGRIEWLPDTVKRPQMQWNKLATHADRDGLVHPLVDGLDGEWVYFVHSLAATVRPAAGATGGGPSVIATTDYGGPVTAVVANGDVMATQFHPEKSATSGLRLLANFVQLCRDRVEVAG